MNEPWNHGTHKSQPILQLDPRESTASLLWTSRSLRQYPWSPEAPRKHLPREESALAPCCFLHFASVLQTCSNVEILFGEQLAQHMVESHFVF